MTPYLAATVVTISSAIVAFAFAYFRFPGRNALFALFDRDHAGRKDAPLKPQIEAKLREAGIAWDGGRIVLLTMPRLFNYVFNPLSVYFCYRRDGSVAALVHEVSNTFGESHFYVLPPRVQERTYCWS